VGEFLEHLRSGWLDGLMGGQAHAVDFSIQTYTGDYDWISGISVDFAGSDTYTAHIPVGLSQAVEGIGPAYADQEAEIDVAFAFSLSLGWGDPAGPSYDFEVTQLELDAEIDTTELVVPLRIGDLEASAGHPQYGMGSLSLEVHVDTAYDEASEGYVVTYDPVGDPVSNVDLDVPVYAVLAGTDVNPGPAGTIGLAGDLFLAADGGRGTSPVTPAPANLGAFTPFLELELADIQQGLESLRDDFLPSLAVSDGFNIDIPFIGASFADVLDLGGRQFFGAYSGR